MSLVRRQCRDGNRSLPVDLQGRPDRHRHTLRRRGARPERFRPDRNVRDRRAAFIALNGGPQFKFNEAISLFVDCTSQAEVDELWDKLSAGGSKGQCGWLKDKFGLSWQIVPSRGVHLINDPDPARAARVMQALMKMTKIDIAKLEAAVDEP